MMKLLRNTIKDNRTYIIILILFGICLIAFWKVKLSERDVYHEWVLESGNQTYFTAESSILQQIGLCIDDASGSMNAQHSQVQISIYDKTGILVAQTEKVSADIPVNSISILKGLISQPIHLRKGEKYRIQCDSAVDQSVLTFSFYGERVGFEKQYMAVCVMSLLLLSFIFFQKDEITDRKFQVTYIVSMLLLGIICSLAMTPLCVPDEMAHFSNAYVISDQMVGVFSKTLENKVLTGIMRIQVFGDAQNSWMFWNDWKYGNSLVNRTDTLFIRSANIPQYPYIFSALGIFILRMLRAPYQIVLIGGRIFNLLFFTLFMIVVMKMLPQFKWIIAAISFLPSTVWILNSYSYDGWNLAFCILLFSFCIYCRIYDKSSILNYFIAAILLLLFVPIKVIYIVFGAALFLLPHKEVSARQKRKLIIYGCIFLAIVLGIFLKIRGHEIMLILSGNNADPRSDAGMMGTSYSLTEVIKHPYSILLVLFKTLIINMDKYITKSFVGENYDTYVPSGITFIIIFLFLILSQKTAKLMNTDRKTKVISCSIFLFGVFFVFIVFLFIFSVPDLTGVGEISGVQGRYFLPFMILVPFLMQKRKMVTDRLKTKRIFEALLLFSLFSDLCKMSGIMINL